MKSFNARNPFISNDIADRLQKSTGDKPNQKVMMQ